MYRVLPLGLLALVLGLFVGAVALAKDAKDKADTTTTEGTVASVDKDKITVTDKDKKDHSFTTDKDTKVTCDGKECKLADLKKDTKVKVSTTGKDKDLKVTAVEATTK
jgi:hypothetical protein